MVLSASKSDRGLGVTFRMPAGGRYVLEFAKSLGAGRWEEVGHGDGTGAVQTVTVPTSNDEQGFYRLRLE
mgnify:CR=1 FL=1